MSSVAFFDPVSPLPYSSETLWETALPGTEASVVRAADALNAYVVQHNRTKASGRYLPVDAIPDVDQVVLIRDSRALKSVRENFPAARIFLWLHDKVRPGSKRGRWLLSAAPLLQELAVTIVCVSNSHRKDVEATLLPASGGKRIRVVTIYNPVDDRLAPDGTPVDSSKLIYFSSPNKGLAFAIDAFRAMRSAIPGLRLVVGNPGYKAADCPQLPGLEYLGPQPQWRIHSEVRSALCTFHPNFMIPETFGLVYAESKALGTPVLTHDFGAAAEIVDDPGQVLPVTMNHKVYEGLARALRPRWRALPALFAKRLGLFDPYIEHISRWRQGARPIVGPDPRFRLTAVAKQWRDLLAACP